MEIHVISGESKLAERDPNENQANKAQAEHKEDSEVLSVCFPVSSRGLWAESGLWADEDAGPVCCVYSEGDGPATGTGTPRSIQK